LGPKVAKLLLSYSIGAVAWSMEAWREEVNHEAMDRRRGRRMLTLEEGDGQRACIELIQLRLLVEALKKVTIIIILPG
jgi:hypothetical protein